MNDFKYVIFTDLDGTLLDKETYRPGRALDTLKRCIELGIPVVFVSAKTRVEIEFIRFELDNESPFISENGGGLFLPINQFDKPGGFTRFGNYWCLQSAETIQALNEALERAAKVTGIKVKTFSKMLPAEIASLTGLDIIRAKLARQREYDEPFQILDETPEKLQSLKTEIVKRRLRYTWGGSFHHIMGNFNKGETISRLKRIYLQKNPDIRFIGIGDSLNDFPMLQIVDHPFLVRKPDCDYERDINIARLKVTDGIGPEGFAEAVESLIKLH